MIGTRHGWARIFEERTFNRRERRERRLLREFHELFECGEQTGRRTTGLRTTGRQKTESGNSIAARRHKRHIDHRSKFKAEGPGDPRIARIDTNSFGAESFSVLPQGKLLSALDNWFNAHPHLCPRRRVCCHPTTLTRPAATLSRSHGRGTRGEDFHLARV